MKRSIPWSLCLILGGTLLAIAQSKDNPAEKVSDSVAGATSEKPYENSLGMRFVPLPGLKVLFGVWETRVQDFREYVRETGYVQSGGVYVMKVAKADGGDYSRKWELDKEASWNNPGFQQGEDHPVVGVNWEEAEAFCAWLTEKEQKAGRIGPEQEYRLPTDKEWSAAVGETNYPWGNNWPPPEKAGNYADDAYVASLPGAGWSQVPGNDGYARTSPVSSFPPNPLGLYDMGGNVCQWCEDWYRGDMNAQAFLDQFPALKDDGGGKKFRLVRGSSWRGTDPVYLLSACRGRGIPGDRNDFYGFRCVLVSGSSSAPGGNL